MEEKLLSKNDGIAALNRAALRGRGVFSINMVSSPGAGKTSIIERSIPFLKDSVRGLAVIEGDIETDLDSMRVKRHGVPVRQITTGRACHLDAHMISHEIPWVCGIEGVRLLIIENVGNLVCPAEFDLGADLTVCVLGCAEGDDKPLKYPAIFNKSDMLLINKTDLVPYTGFNVERAVDRALKINPCLKVFKTSCSTGEGIGAWCACLSGLVSNVVK
ncbi:MAG: hydrogenase nickel incorporation protein HypB [Deltaproteobacteria bacterium]|nr:hydrogenase nickel incorporation protein HypB [Deltaproteobacteria bacterium]